MNADDVARIRPGLEAELAWLLNSYSAENESDTPDFVLAQYLIGSLMVFNNAVRRRTEWYGPDQGGDIKRWTLEP